MNKEIYVATFAEDAIETIKDYHVNMEFNHLCISDNLDRHEETLKEMKEDFNKSIAEKAIVHGPFTEIIPASMDSRAREFGLERLNQAYEFCQELNVKRMVVHSGYIPLLYYKSWHIEKSVVFWKDFLRDKSDDFNIYIENVFEDEPYMMRELVESIGDKRVGICLDIGHANAMGDLTIEKWVEVLRPHIRHMHIHNNFGDLDSHNEIKDGNINIKEIINLMKRLDNSGFSIGVESRISQGTVKELLTYI